jgi:hypothetical protein
VSEKEGERDAEYGMTGALAPFSYLVLYSSCCQLRHLDAYFGCKVIIKLFVNLSLVLDCSREPGTVFKTLHFIRNLQIGPKKLKCYITQCRKSLPGPKTLACWAHLQVAKKMKCCQFSPNFQTF